MAICRYCGEKAGWFSEAHGSCIQKAAQGIEALKQCVADAIVQGKQYPEIKTQLDKIVADSNIPQDQVLPAIKDGWSQGAKNRCIAQPISDDELSSISDFYRSAGLPKDEIPQDTGVVRSALQLPDMDGSPRSNRSVPRASTVQSTTWGSPCFWDSQRPAARRTHEKFLRRWI
jgi:hypothetical protein